MKTDLPPSPAMTICPEDGTAFDGILARRVEAVLAHAAAGSRFVIDLSHLSEFHDFAIAVLAHAVTTTPAEVTVRGLRYHQVRILRSFDVDTERLEGALLSAAA